MKSYQQTQHSFNTYPRTALLRVTRNRPCPVCGKPDNCNVTEDGALAYCRRVRSAKQGKDGGWSHILRLDAPLAIAPIKSKTIAPSPTTERASSERCADVYLALIREHLTLSSEHRNSLHKRGLPDGIITANGYASTPTQSFAANVARALQERFGLDGVPGFFKQAGRWSMVNFGSGIFIPIRSSDGLIQGFQVRRDEGEPRYIWFSSTDRDGGASSGSPLHFANWLLLPDASEITLTEGALKADIAAHFLNAPVVAAAGVSCFGENFAANLREKFPKLKTCVVAFDSDFRTKPQVKASLDKLIRQLSAVGLRVRVRTWAAELGKGIDDYLLHLAHADRRAA